MGNIRILPEVLASQVAAGEVVERPASVVKELIENSLDAGATRISVVARRGGSALLRITDDGHGMPREDALLCLERHATSKLQSAGDLAAIRTKGFRGEALPSIASVSKFTLATRGHDALTGTRITVEGGTVVEICDDGDAPGTSVEVRQLFFNVPARRKFLRSEDTEFSHIEQQVRVQALAHPETGFSLTRDDRLLFHLAPGESFLERITGLAGGELAGRLLEIPDFSEGPITVSGYLGEPGVWRSNRALQYTFLNRRPVDSVAFSQALRAGYGEALPRGQAAVAFLQISIDPAEVDVNVHPAKREVRFRHSLAVQSALTAVIARVLRSGRPGRVAGAEPVAAPDPTPVPKWNPPVVQPHLPERFVPTGTGSLSGLAEAGSKLAPVTAGAGNFRDPAIPGENPHPDLPREPSVSPVAGLVRPAHVPVSAKAEQRENPGGWPQPAPSPVADPGMAGTARTLPVFRPVGLLGTAYIILESSEGLVLMDHRGAWERILYEEALSRPAGESLSQSLLTPLTVTLSPREYDFLKPQLPALRRMGLCIEEFGSNTVLVDGLPPFLQADGDLGALISGLLDDLKHAGERTPLKRLDDASIAAAVSRQAARRQPPQSMESAAGLTERLMACGMPYCRPDGSPTLLQFSWQELARKFSRPGA